MHDLTISHIAICVKLENLILVVFCPLPVVSCVRPTDHHPRAHPNKKTPAGESLSRRGGWVVKVVSYELREIS